MSVVVSKIAESEFPNCMHSLAAAFHLMNVDPAGVVITLPREQWWKLQCQIESRFRGLMTYDGRGGKDAVWHEFTYMGFKFRPGPT